MLDRKDKAAIGGILVTSLITNAVWIIVFLQHHAEWKKCYGELLTYCNEINDKWYDICRRVEEDDIN